MRRMRKIIGRHEGLMLAVVLVYSQLGCSGSSGEGPIMATLCTEAFTACGGDPTGTWDVAGVCVDGDLAAALNSQRSAACMSATTAVDLKATGSVTYMGTAPDTLVVYKTTVTMRSTESISPACATEAFAVTTLDAAACTQIATSLKNVDPDLAAETTVSCSLAGGNCDCRTTIADVQMEQKFITVTGSNILESDDQTYDFCINGTAMTQKQLLAGNVSAVARFTKK
jgi:hypothetical protein